MLPIYVSPCNTRLTGGRDLADLRFAAGTRAKAVVNMSDAEREGVWNTVRREVEEVLDLIRLAAPSNPLQSESPRRIGDRRFSISDLDVP